MDFKIPTVVTLQFIVPFFIVLLFVFDIVLVRCLKLKKTTWKRVDYIWLGFAALGLVGAAAQARQVVATNMSPRAEAHKRAWFGDVTRKLDLYSTSSIVCRRFIRAPLSPPPDEFERAQKEYDTACEWFRSVKATAPTEVPNTEISVPATPMTSDEILNKNYADYRATVAEFNDALREEKKLRDATTPSEIEGGLAFLGPLLLAFALALRITKVTADIKFGWPR
jgi:hypothetical protein